MLCFTPEGYKIALPTPSHSCTSAIHLALDLATGQSQVELVQTCDPPQSANGENPPLDSMQQRVLNNAVRIARWKNETTF